jgi:hypothetical protein
VNPAFVKNSVLLLALIASSAFVLKIAFQSNTDTLPDAAKAPEQVAAQQPFFEFGESVSQPNINSNGGDSTLAEETKFHASLPVNANKTVAPEDAQRLIDAYMSAWSGGDMQRIDALWEKISACDACLLTLKEMMMNQGMPQGMLLELTYRIIAHGDPRWLDVFDYLIQPSVTKSTRVIVTQQMIRDGRAMYVEKLLRIFERLYTDGYEKFAFKQMWMFSKLKNPTAAEPFLEIMSGRKPASDAYADHVSTVFVKSVLPNVGSLELNEQLQVYYKAAHGPARERLWEVIKQSEITLADLASTAHEKGLQTEFERYTSAIAELQPERAVEGLLRLSTKVDFPRDYFTGLLQDVVAEGGEREALFRLEDYLRDPAQPFNTKMLAADALLHIKENNAQARYILQKAVSVVSYEDADIAAYINARM